MFCKIKAIYQFIAWIEKNKIQNLSRHLRRRSSNFIELNLITSNCGATIVFFMKGFFCEATILKLSIEINFHAAQWNPTNLRPNWEFFAAAISQDTSPSFSFRKPEKFLWNHTDIKIWTQSDRLELHSLNFYLNKYSCMYVTKLIDFVYESSTKYKYLIKLIKL